MSNPDDSTFYLQTQKGRITIAKSNSEEVNPPEFESLRLDDEVSPRAPSSRPFSVLGVDMRKVENKKAHNTGRYKNSCLIVRRNKEFIIDIRFDRPFNIMEDTVEVEFLIGSSPDVNRGTHIIVSIGKDKNEMIWRCRVLNTKGNQVTVGITPDTDCIVGRFRTFVCIVRGKAKQRTPKNPDTDVYVLFNPWDSADEVYMSKQSDRQEYVLNDVGVIFNGEFTDMSSRPWNYGQFEKGVLDACLMVLDAGKVPLVYRGNANEVVRQASALINSQDDDGVLVGNWSGDYDIGTSPTAWNGSPEILLKYAREDGVPVCFAQCWVYAGVLNTFLRCLGLPARVITNYNSAHDNNGNLKIDIMLDEDGTVNRSRTRDSVWNYHCWNEVYMKRPDLPQKFSGWQVVDSTPQETSDGLYRCGPTSVSALKDGELSYPFDGKFVYAEFNSDVIYHEIDKYGKTKILHVDTTYVGKRIVTKLINSNKYEDITSTYKYPEGSKSDKAALQLAERSGVTLRDYDYDEPAEAGVDIQLQANTIKLGEDFKLTMNIKNQSSKRCTINATITGSVVFYTGVTTTTVMRETIQATVEAWKTETLLMEVRAKEYIPHLVDQSNLLFVMNGRIQETGVTLTTMRVVTLRPPELTIRVSGSPRVDQAFTVIVEFLNVLNFALEDVQCRLESPGLIQTKFKSYEQILPGGIMQYTESITPLEPGQRVLIAGLDCTQLRQVTNQLEINILAV
ncbi:Coagulation factor XIII A chain [Triplophysa tibetana]|uniref:protein-glutamine gamma-glutamyltransferase n=1 Tax=Triplophysa tibetana TaxID=1572043 RepID=A0A5A9N5B9_9TELE|nr:Coagulation factor XIII A chain [Triplophysa tibetana]